MNAEYIQEPERTLPVRYADYDVIVAGGGIAGIAAALAAAIEEKYPGLCRPIFFCSRSYNYACSDGALLLEFGTNGNTMEEAQYTAELIAPVIAKVISGRAE